MNTRSAITFRSFAALLATTTLAIAQIDGRASHEPMFGPSGALPPSGTVRLDGGLPPIPGSTATWTITAPGFSYGFAGLSGNANIGWHPLMDPLTLYLDPLALIGSLPLPLSGGFGTLPLPLPPAPSLSGLDLAMQAIVLSPSGGLAGSNLVVSNLGLDAGMGSAVFAFTFGPISLPPNQCHPNGQAPTPIVENATAAAKDYTIQLNRSAGGGTLVVRNAAGTAVATVPPNQTTLTVSVTVPPGGKLFLCNQDRNATVNGVSWSITVG
ncbi:MAG: hypothetical protein IPK26_28055 [Planctomycetes bacterium]|nr:hypothetical protein [Planctomycetota bacterium]